MCLEVQFAHPRLEELPPFPPSLYGFWRNSYLKGFCQYFIRAARGLSVYGDFIYSEFFGVLAEWLAIRKGPLAVCCVSLARENRSVLTGRAFGRGAVSRHCSFPKLRAYTLRAMRDASAGDGIPSRFSGRDIEGEVA